MAAAAGDEMAAATDVADLLVRQGMPFREAHGVVGGLVRHALEQGIALSEIGRDELAGFCELLDDEYYEVLGRGRLAGVEGLPRGDLRRSRSVRSSSTARETLERRG